MEKAQAHKEARKCTCPMYVDEHFGMWRSLSGHDVVRETVQAGPSSFGVEKFGQCQAEDGAEIDPVLQA